MSQVKTFKISGYLKKGGRRISFTKDLKALEEAEALEKIYAEVGSRHKAKRFDIKVIEVSEVKMSKESK